MRFEGQQTYAAAPETLRLLLNDPVALREIIPGCQNLEATGPNEYQVRLTLRIGQNIETFEGMLKLDQATPTGDITFHVVGATSTAVTARGRLAFDQQSDGETRVTYEAEAAADGPPAVSPRLMQTTGRAFVRRCLQNLERQVAIRTRVYTTVTAAPAVVVAPPGAAWQRAEMRRRLSVVAVLALLILLLGRGLGRRARGAGAVTGGSAA